MSEIKVGEYVRSKDGIIGKFVEIDKCVRYYGERLEDVIYRIYVGDTLDYQYLRIKKEDITKHSSNIIDLIEVKDIVHIVICDEDDIDGENPMETAWYIDNEYILGNIISSIKANRASLLGIVTKEQFSSMEYRLGGNEE